MRRPRFQIDEQRLRLRAFLWPLAALAIVLAILSTADVLDGSSHVGWGRRVTIWDEPLLFAAPVAVCLLCVTMASIFWLAVVSDLNEQWLPAKLRGKPLPLVAIMSLLTLGAAVFGAELLGGDMELRRLGHVTAEGTPLRFLLVAAGYLLSCALIAGGWYSVKHSWNGRPTGMRNAPLDEPDKRSPM